MMDQTLCIDFLLEHVLLLESTQEINVKDALKEILTVDIPEILSQNQNAVLIEPTLFMHLMHQFTFRWDYVNIRPKKDITGYSISWKDMFLGDNVELIFLINNLVKSSFFNKTSLKYSLLATLTDDLKTQLHNLDPATTQYQHKYQLLLNLLAFDIAPHKVSRYEQNNDLLDFNLFLDLHDAAKTDASDLLLINDDVLNVYDKLDKDVCLMKLKFQCPNLTSNAFTVLRFKSETEELILNISTKGMHLIQRFIDNTDFSEHCELLGEAQYSINRDTAYELVLKFSASNVSISLADEKIIQTRLKLASKMSVNVGDSQAVHLNKALFLYDFMIYKEKNLLLHKLDLRDLKCQSKELKRYFDNSSGLFLSLSNSMLIECYSSVNFFKKLVYFITESDSETFFKNVLPKLLIHSGSLIPYSELQEASIENVSFYNIVFFTISKKIPSFYDVEFVLETLFAFLLQQSCKKNEYDFCKVLIQYVFAWQFLNDEQYIYIIRKLRIFFAGESDKNGDKNLQWLVKNVPILDLLLDNIENFLNQNIKTDAEVYTFIRSMMKTGVNFSIANLLYHLLQRCVFKLSVETNCSLKLTEIILAAAIDTICALNPEDKQFSLLPFVELCNVLLMQCIRKNTAIPISTFEKCLFLVLIITKKAASINENIARTGIFKLFGFALLLDKEENYPYLEIFCKLLLIAAFDIEKSSTAFYGSRVLEVFDLEIYLNNVGKESAELHILLLKILCTCSMGNTEFLKKYFKFIGSVVPMNTYLAQLFKEDCKVLLQMISVSINYDSAANVEINECISSIFTRAVAEVDTISYYKFITTLSKDIYDSSKISITANTKIWVALKILPSAFRSFKSSSFNEKGKHYWVNLKETVLFFGDILLTYEVAGEFVLDFLKCIFPLFEQDMASSSINLFVSKGLGIDLKTDYILNENVMSLVIENQHHILTNDVFFPIFIQLVSFTSLNYISTDQNKEEKLAFLKILLNACALNFKSNKIYAIGSFISKDYNMKKLIEKLATLENMDFIQVLEAKKNIFQSYLARLEQQKHFNEPPFKVITEANKLSKHTDKMTGTVGFEQEMQKCNKLLGYVLNFELKNKQFRKIDIQDSVESTQQRISSYIDDLKTLEYCFSSKKQKQDELAQFSIYRGFNKMMQRKIIFPQVKSNIVDNLSPEVTNTLPNKEFSDNKQLITKELDTNFQKDAFDFTSSKETTLNQNRRILKRLSLNETIKNIWNACIVTGICIENGVLILTENTVLFYKHYYYRAESGSIIKRDEMSVEETGSLIALNFNSIESKPDFKQMDNKDQDSVIKILKEDISFCIKRVFVFKDIACEFFNKYNESFFITFVNKNLRDKFYNEVHRSLFSYSRLDINDDSNMFSHVFKSMNLEANNIVSKNGIGQFSLSSKITSVFQTLVSENVSLESLTREWQTGRISNFFYLLAINFYAGRSFNDITQYPIFPWVISDYESDILDLNNPSSFRDLTKPMGAQDPIRLQNFLERYSAVEELNDSETPPFHYGTHYSSAMIVASYLIRIEPFTSSFKILQGGGFGPADRIFNSLERTWKSASKELTTDVRELIPEFFFFPEFLENINGTDFGVLQNGGKVDNVILPKWCGNKSFVFIQKNLEALESDYVSENINHWIDLIFGFKQRGKHAKLAANVFNQLTYSGAVKIDNIVDSKAVALVTNIIHNFGQTPLQLFEEPHLKKDLNYFNKNVITIKDFYTASSDNLSDVDSCKYCKNIIPVSAKLQTCYHSIIDGDSFGVIRKHDIEEPGKCKTLYAYAHTKPIKTMLYSDNFDVLVSLDDAGVCLKWVLSTMKLLGRVTFVYCDNIIMSNYSSNVIFKVENSFVLSTFNGTILNDDIFKGIANLGVYDFVDLSASVKKKLPHLIDYLIVSIGDKIYLYEIVLSNSCEYILERKNIQINSKGIIATKFDALIILDDCDNNQLHLSLKFQTTANGKAEVFEF